jgi:capsular polysaccharide biosynthesis protein
MKIVIITLAILWIWIIYEFITAPTYNETTGKFIKKTKSSGSYSDLEKLGRGRSKH